MPPLNQSKHAPASQIRATILRQITDIADRHGKTLAPLSDDLLLLDSGLDSLCIAILVAALDDELDLDPFAEEELVAFPVTVGDLISLYEDAGA